MSAHRRLLPPPGSSRLPSWCLRLYTHLPSHTCQRGPPFPPSPLLSLLALGEEGVGWGSPRPVHTWWGGDLGKEVKVAALRGTQPSTWGPVCLLQPPPSPEPLGAVGVCGCPWEPTLAQAVMSAHRFLCLPVHARAHVSGVCVFVGGLQWPPGPLSITLVGPHGVQSGHQCQIVGSGGEVSPPTLAAGKGEGEREVRTSPQHY